VGFVPVMAMAWAGLCVRSDVPVKPARRAAERQACPHPCPRDIAAPACARPQRWRLYWWARCCSPVALRLPPQGRSRPARDHVQVRTPQARSSRAASPRSRWPCRSPDLSAGRCSATRPARAAPRPTRSSAGGSTGPTPRSRRGVSSNRAGSSVKETESVVDDVGVAQRAEVVRRRAFGEVVSPEQVDVLVDQG